jgi:hypothetical protein
MEQLRRAHDDCKMGRGADDDSAWPVRILPGSRPTGLTVRAKPAITRPARSDPKAADDPPVPETCHRSDQTMKQTAVHRKAPCVREYKSGVINM